jgi:hypothetical protein
MQGDESRECVIKEVGISSEIGSPPPQYCDRHIAARIYIELHLAGALGN